jgi:hypothetical protein
MGRLFEKFAIYQPYFRHFLPPTKSPDCQNWAKKIWYFSTMHLTLINNIKLGLVKPPFFCYTEVIYYILCWQANIPQYIGVTP